MQMQANVVIIGGGHDGGGPWLSPCQGGVDRCAVEPDIRQPPAKTGGEKIYHGFGSDLTNEVALIKAEVDATACEIWGGKAVMHGDVVVGVCTGLKAGLEGVILGQRHALTPLDAPTLDPTNTRQKT